MNIELKRLIFYFLEHKEIVASWGITDIVTANHEISFSVSGFNYQGRISIKSNRTGYTITIGGILRWHNIKLDDVIPALDKWVENDTNYYLTVCEWIENQRTNA